MDTVDALIVAGAGVDKPELDGWAPLMVAAEKGHGDIVTLLLKAHADPLKCSQDGKWAPLGAACEADFADVALQLAEGAPDALLGAYTAYLSRAKRTCFHMAGAMPSV